MTEAWELPDVLFDRDEGYVAVRFGRGEDGFERRYRWPDERDELVADALREDAAGRDAYFSPAQRFNDQRRKGDGRPRRWAWVDVDHGFDDEQDALVAKLDGVTVLSGSPGARHLYVRLSRPVGVAVSEALNRGLRDRLAGDHKWSDESLLRLPGTHNHKTDPPRPVILERVGATVWEPDALAAELELDLDRPARPTSGGASRAEPPVAEPAPDPLPQLVVRALARRAQEFDAGRSGAHHNLVGACRDSRLTLGQTVTVAGGYPSSVEKYGERPGGVAAAVAASWANVDAGPTVLPRREPAATAGPLPTLPEEFWSARESLGHIRTAAHARCVSADLVLHVAMARLASVQHHKTRVETGLGSAALNLFTTAVGVSGAGKTTGVAVGRELVSVPRSVASWDGYRDGVPIGSGEGLAEMFVGTKQVPTGEKYMTGPSKGQPKTKAVRAQVRHNALVYVDEGESLFRITERKGATIAPALRSAWTGGVLGQSNASAETTRVIPAGSYALGLVIGVQVDTAGPLFADEAGGTPQRFLFCSATDPAIPDEAPVWPGPLPGVKETARAGVTVPLVDRDVRARLRAEHLARHRGQAEQSNPLDAHRPLHLAKIAALLAILDGRLEVNGEDWSLAEQVWETSTAVRSALIRRGRDLEREQAERKATLYVEREERAAHARDQASTKVQRIAVRLVERVRGGHEQTRPALARRLAAKERHLLDAALDHALDEGWIVASGPVFEPGPEAPS